jgi:hypothetical protein
LANWRKLYKPELAKYVLATLERMLWLREHDSELQNGHVWRLRLAALLRGLYGIKAGFTEPELIAVLNATVPLLGSIEPYGPVERVGEYLKHNDLTPALCQALRRMQENLRQEMSISQASMQSLRQQLHMLLWLDEWEPLDPAHCWSDCVRRDFRTFAGERQQQWRALFKHIRGNAPVRMPAGWARDAEPLLARVGKEDFLDQLQLWFAPFRSGQALPLSVAGSHVLKGLIWYAAVSHDEDAKACCLWVLDAKWKQKRNTEKVLTALTELGVAKDSLPLARTQAPPGHAMKKLIAKLQQVEICRPADRIQLDAGEDMFVVQGQLHFYRVFRSSGRIERVSDNAVLQVNWPAVPDSIRLLLERNASNEEQAHMRALLLTHDGVFGQYFTAK